MQIDIKSITIVHNEMSDDEIILYTDNDLQLSIRVYPNTAEEYCKEHFSSVNILEVIKN